MNDWKEIPGTEFVVFGSVAPRGSFKETCYCGAQSEQGWVVSTAGGPAILRISQWDQFFALEINPLICPTVRRKALDWFKEQHSLKQAEWLSPLNLDLRRNASNLSTARKKKRRKSRKLLRPLPVLDATDWIDALPETERFQEMSQLLSVLTEREHFILHQRLCKNATLQQIADRLATTRERVRQIQIEATQKLRRRYRRIEQLP